MKSMTVSFYNGGAQVTEIKEVIKITVYDKGYIRVEYKDGDEIRIIESNLPFIYYDGVKDEK